MIAQYFGTWGLACGWALALICWGIAFVAILKANRLSAIKSGTPEEWSLMLRALIYIVIGGILALLLTR